MEEKKGRVRFGELAAYTAGGFASQIANRTMVDYLMIFFTNCLLLDPVSAGAIFLWARIIDAISDLVMANVTDRTRTKLGSFRPFIIYGAIPLAVVFVLCFTAPNFLVTQGQKLFWAYVTYIVEGSILQTICGVSHGAMISVMSEDPADRPKISSARFIGENAAVLLISAFTTTIVLKVGGTLAEPAGWRTAAIIFAVCIAVGYLICGFFTKERVENVPKGKDPLPLKERIKCFKGNTPFWCLFFIMVAMMLNAVFHGTSAAYYVIYKLGHAEWMAPVKTMNAAFGVAAAFAFSFIAKKLEKRTIILIGAACFIIGPVILTLTGSYFGMMVDQAITGIGNALVMACAISLVPDSAEYGALKNGVTSNGLIYSATFFAIKAASGFGNYFVGLVMSIFGFDTAAAVQTERALNGLTMSILIFCVVLSVIAIILSFLMKGIDKENLEAMRAAKAAKTE